MSIQSEIDRISGNVQDTISAIQATGVPIPSGANSDDLPALAQALANEKQDKLTGQQGQYVGFDSNGAAVATSKPTYTASEVGAYTKQETLQSNTAARAGLGADAVPNDVFKMIMFAKIVCSVFEGCTGVQAVGPGGKSYVGVLTDELTYTIIAPDYGMYSVSATYSDMSLTDQVLVSACTQYFISLYPAYGVKWDGGPSTKWTRFGKSKNFPDPSPAVANGTGSSPFDDISPWSGMQKVSMDGNSMVSIPKFWYRWTALENSGIQLEISNVELSGFSVSPAHQDRGDGQGERDIVYVARYASVSESGWKSVTGKTPTAYISFADGRTKAHSIGSEYWMWDYALYQTIFMLYLVEFADWDVQAAIGLGGTASGNAENNGKTDAMEYCTGTTASSKNNAGICQYRNIEGIWSNISTWVDGCRFANWNGENAQMYIIKNPQNFSVGYTAGVPVGRPFAQEGFIISMAIPEVDGLDWAIYPSSGGELGSGTTYIPDTSRFLEGSDALFMGGGDNTSLENGWFYMFGYGTTAYNYIGVRLMKLPSNE